LKILVSWPFRFSFGYKAVPVFQASNNIASGLSLNSWEFLLIAAVAILASALISDLKVRNAALLALNIYMLLALLVSPTSLVVLAIFLVASYGIGRWRKIVGRQMTMLMQLGIVAGLWAFLFMVRDGRLFGAVNPFHYLPVQIIGISYMVFRSISFIMEVEFVERPNFLRYCNYVLFFPGLLAGPIERYRTFETQLARPLMDPATVMPALHRIADGFIKKFVIADNLAVFGVFSFDNATEVSTPLLWIGTLAQLGLIYLDFSGYCDIMIGIAALMGFRMIENFNRPFSATNIQDFWNRWHISLSTLVKDYIFTPINIVIIKNTRREVQFGLITIVYFFSMILIGLWHGMTWGFVAFGSVHGGALVASQFMKKGRKPAQALTAWWSAPLKRFGVYAFVSTSLILWLKSASEWGRIYGKLIGLGP
jgi:alginate O-acetyltransferase complex protein AlgI